MPTPDNTRIRFRFALLGAIALSVLLRAVFAGSFELLMEEAYYWNYAQHPSPGYLDHPPMVALLIMIATFLLGNSELGVRIGALLCWCVAAVFVYLYARDLKDRDNALQATAIMALLPAFFIAGLFMTPDAPLLACWAGAVFFARRAVLGRQRWRDWLGLGLCLGLGLLSKYTIALLGVALALFLIVDPPSRRWFVKPQPYAAVLVALLLFSPVIYWNLENGWSSFLFQSHNRLTASSEFSVHELLLFILILLTPVGVAALGAVLSGRTALIRRAGFGARDCTFALTLMLVPLAIFTTISFTKEVKLSWTIPIWVSALPLLAATLSGTSGLLRAPAAGRFATAWRLSGALLLLGYSAVFVHLAVGIPGVPYPKGGPLLGWRDLAAQLDQVVEEIERERGVRPVVAGMDLYRTASGLSFYRTLNFEAGGSPAGLHPLGETIGRTMLDRLGRSSLMFGYWFPPEAVAGRPLLAVSPRRAGLEDVMLAERVAPTGEIGEIYATRNGRRLSPLYYRLVLLD